MRFFRNKGRQGLDLQGDLILSKNHAIVQGTSASSVPRPILNATYAADLVNGGFLHRLRATSLALRFIWGFLFSFFFLYVLPFTLGIFTGAALIMGLASFAG